jgi:DNA adenine methylase
MVNTVFPYPGGKTYMANWIINHFPRHNSYVEPFGGGASVLVNKPKSNVEVYNDRDGDVVHFFRVLRNRPDELVDWLDSRPYAKDLHEKYARAYYSGYRPDDDVERAGRFFYLRKSQFVGKYNGYSGFRSGSKRNIAEGFSGAVDKLEAFATRFKSVQIENRDYAEVLSRFDSSDSLFYCDPPYVEEGDDLYSGDSFDHSRFVDAITSVDGYWIVSYTDLPPGLTDYHTVEKEQAQHMRKGQDEMKRSTRTERLVMNFDPSQTVMMSRESQSELQSF